MTIQLNDILRIVGREFIIVGLPLDVTGESLADVEDRIYGGTRKRINSVWCTLGWANDKKVSWEGKLQTSGEGNDRIDERELSGEEAILIDKAFPEAGGVQSVRERFINFDLVDFKTNVTVDELLNPDFSGTVLHT